MTQASTDGKSATQAEIQKLLRGEIDALRAQLKQSFAKIDELTTKLEALPAPAASPADLAALEQRHRIEITLLHALYRSWQQGPAAGVPGFDHQIALIQASELFDSGWYLGAYPDVGASGLSPAEHYVRSGAFEGRNPGPHFDTMAYYLANPDVAHASWPALVHYVGFGRAEGRPLR